MPYAQARTEILIGKAALEFLQKKTIMVVGLGGVGGFAAEAIARSGVNNMIIIDHDSVSPSNLNRQLLALNSTLNEKKTAVMRSRLLDINPDLNLTVIDCFIRPENIAGLLDKYEADYVLDCIDSIACKAALVKSAQDKNIPVISAMGAGNSLDVRNVKIDKLKKTNVCPLAREMRKQLKNLGASLNYPVVYSDEQRRKPLPHQPISGAEPGRARAVNGTISYLPGLLGLMMSGYVINEMLSESGLLD